jgi:uroporphyrinogen decarboxylase
MTSRERISRMYRHCEADRIPIVDSPWAGTLERWKREGMPGGCDWRDYFGVDKAASIGVDVSPRYQRQILEDTPEYYIEKTSWGATVRQWKHQDSTPEFLHFEITTKEKWEAAKALMLPEHSRINWKHLEENYPKWQAEGQWVEAYLWFGFDVTHSWTVGTETMLVAMLEEPEWATDMFSTYLDCCIAMFDQVWDAGYRFDGVTWPDDMGYKGTTFFSPAMYRALLKPFHKRCVDWAHRKGIPARLHSCGYIEPLLDDLMDVGIDALNPLEVKAGMKALEIKHKYGDRLVLHGGINAVLWDQKDQILSEIDHCVPKLMQNGGYIFASDHSIPNSVSLENFEAIVSHVKKIGSY